MGQIQYGIDMSEVRMAMPYVDVPSEIMDQIHGENLIPVGLSKNQQEQLPIAITPLDGVSRLTVRTRRIGRAREADREALSAQAVAALAMPELCAESSQVDPRLAIFMSSHRLSDGERLGFMCHGLLSVPLDSTITKRVTWVMRQVAADVGYLREEGMTNRQHRTFISSMVYCTNNDSVITLQTLPEGACSADTDGYCAEIPTNRFELYGHNIYAHSQQLIIASGAIALVNAAELQVA